MDWIRWRATPRTWISPFLFFITAVRKSGNPLEVGAELSLLSLFFLFELERFFHLQLELIEEFQTCIEQLVLNYWVYLNSFELIGCILWMIHFLNVLRECAATFELCNIEFWFVWQSWKGFLLPLRVNSDQNRNPKIGQTSTTTNLLTNNLPSFEYLGWTNRARKHLLFLFYNFSIWNLQVFCDCSYFILFFSLNILFSKLPAFCIYVHGLCFNYCSPLHRT